MLFIDKIRGLYKDNTWKQEKRDKADKAKFDKDVSRAVKYFVKNAESTAKDGYKRFYAHRLDVFFNDRVLDAAKVILAQDYGITLTYGDWDIYIKGWA